MSSQTLWEQGPAYWRYYFANYQVALESKSEDLPPLDSAVWNDLSQSIRAREKPHITVDDYVKIVSWKLKRGKNRPRLLSFAKSLTNETVIEASSTAFANLSEDDPSLALNPLVELRGCGPATASAVIAIVDPSFPFMSDELLSLAPGDVKYTKPVYLSLINLAREKAKQLSSAKEGGGEWTACDVEKAAFSYLNEIKAPSVGDLHKYNSLTKALENESEADCTPTLSKSKAHPAEKRVTRQRSSAAVLDSTASNQNNGGDLEGTTGKTLRGGLRRQAASRGLEGNAKETSKAARKAPQIQSRRQQTDVREDKDHESNADVLPKGNNSVPAAENGGDGRHTRRSVTFAIDVFPNQRSAGSNIAEEGRGKHPDKNEGTETRQDGSNENDAGASKARKNKPVANTPQGNGSIKSKPERKRRQAAPPKDALNTAGNDQTPDMEEADGSDVVNNKGMINDQKSNVQPDQALRRSKRVKSSKAD